MLALLAALACSLAVTLFVVHATKTRGALLLDSDTSGPQKFHARPVARVGGIGIFAGLLLALAPLWAIGPEAAKSAAWLLACGLPAFAAGLLEDLTKRVRPLHRLIATAVSALLAAWILGALITRTDIFGLDWLVSHAFGATLLTALAVAGIANSINIIDVFNGLASMCVMIMLAALAYVAFQVGDVFIGTFALAAIGAVLGFFLWNYPPG